MCNVFGSRASNQVIHVCCMDCSSGRLMPVFSSLYVDLMLNTGVLQKLSRHPMICRYTLRTSVVHWLPIQIRLLKPLPSSSGSTRAPRLPWICSHHPVNLLRLSLTGLSKRATFKRWTSPIHLPQAPMFTPWCGYCLRRS